MDWSRYDADRFCEECDEETPHEYLRAYPGTAYTPEEQAGWECLACCHVADDDDADGRAQDAAYERARYQE